jgi:hypothetical protein
MTDIERLRADLINLARECDGAEGLGSGIIAHRIRCIVVDHFTRLTADYERLRGMEERVKGAVITRMWESDQDTLETDPIKSDDAYMRLIGQTVALVPVPGGEGK